MVQRLREKVLCFLIKLNVHLFYDPSVSFLFTVPKKLYKKADSRGFLLLQNEKQPPRLSTGECTKHSQAMTCCGAAAACAGVSDTRSERSIAQECIQRVSTI